MADRLTLARALEGGGIGRDAAEHIATEILDSIHENVATKSDVRASEAALRTEIVELKTEIAALRTEVALVEHRLLTRGGQHGRCRNRNSGGDRLHPLSCLGGET